jgi:amino acid adenylation domain-containing protein
MKNRCIALMADETPSLVIGMLGILGAGNCFVPINPVFPDKRIHFVINDCKISILLSDKSNYSRAQQIAAENSLIDHVICIDSINDTPGATQESIIDSSKEFTPDQPCYVIYTSGSTGQPKGVQISHRNLMPLLEWSRGYFKFNSNCRVLQNLSYTFDFGVFEIITTCIFGGTLYFFNKEEIGDFTAYVNFVHKHRVNTIHTTPSFFSNIVAVGCKMPTLRTVHLGGERLTGRLVGELSKLVPGNCILHNGYGPTEATINASIFSLNASGAGSVNTRDSVPIGKPSANNILYILSKYNRLQPIGVAGELCIAGPGLAGGYLNNPELTAERFLYDINRSYRCSRSYISKKIYKTGDLVRWLPDGNIDFLGRIDHQVKIRGFRIELGEIEKCLLNHPSIKEAVVMATEGEKRDTGYLCAYIVTGTAPAEIDKPEQEHFESLLPLNMSELRDYLSEKLPVYMIPAYFVSLDRMPLTTAGKVDRKALPKPDEHAIMTASEYAAPANEIEEKLVYIWHEILGIERIGREGDFFDLGGDSILVNRCITAIRESLGVEISLRKFFEKPYIKALAEEIAKQERRVFSIPKAPQHGDIPLSFPQERLWFLQKLDPDSASYFVPRVLRIEGQLKIDLFERTFTEIIRRHEILRTVFVTKEGKPVQQVREPYEFKIPVIDLSGLEEPQQSVRVENWLKEEGRRPFDFEKGPMLRVTLLKLKETEHLFMLTEHHLIHDGWTQGVLLKEFITIFSAYFQGGDHHLPELPIQYADFAVWQREYMQGDRLERHLAYWKEKLSGLGPVLELPVDRPRPPVFRGRGNLKRIHLSTSLSSRLKEFSLNNGVTLFMTMLAVFKTLLVRYTGEEDLCIGTGMANRHHKEMEGMLGMVINTLPLRTRLTGDITFAECLRRIKATCLEAYQHQDTPFEQIVNVLAPERSLSYTPLFQVLFSFMDTPTEDLVLPGLELHLEQSHNRSSKFDIFITVIPLHGQDREDGAWENPGEILVEWEYNTDIFNDDTMERMLGHYVRLLERGTETPNETVYALPMLTSLELARLLVEFNNTNALYPKEKTIHELFEEQVERTPDHIAGIGPSLRLVQQLSLKITYRKLNEKSNRLAYWLREKGIEPDNIVGIMVEHSVEMITGILGILKCGGAYMPIDPDFPQKRIDSMLKDSGVEIIVGNHHLRGTDLAPVTRNPQPVAIPSNLAYIIYTSGTTGKPKGVMIPHQGLVNYSWWAAQMYVKDEPVNFPLYSNLSFDLTVTSIFTPLITGGAVIVYNAEQQSFLIDQIITDNKVGVIKLTPSHLKLMPQMNDSSNLKRLIVGGEALETQLARYINEGFQGKVEIFNEYGPTETTVGCMIYRFDPLSDNGKSVPIGRPAHNVQIYVLDNNYSQLPCGVTGELFVAGDGVARGYLNRPELTAEKFDHDFWDYQDDWHKEKKVAGRPRSRGAGSLLEAAPLNSEFYPKPYAPGPRRLRMYKTGDLVRFMPEGNIELLGRKDHQVKIRGYRVELAEIENLLRNYKFTPRGQQTIPGNIQNTRAPEAVSRCRHCLLSANYPGLTFNQDGVCNVCEEYRQYESHIKRYFKTGKDFLNLVKSVKNTNPAGKYDCLLLFSGGKDSSYVLYRLVEMGLKVLTFTFDNGYISETAFANIKRIASQLAVDNIVGKAEHMDRVFVESLRTNHNVCHGCWYALNGVGIKFAKENNVPMVISGLSRGQIFDMRLHGLFQVGIFSEEEIQNRLQLFRKTYHSRKNKFSEILDIQLPEDTIEAIQFVDFFRYDNTPVQHIKKYLREHGWVQPADTGFCSSNCVINDVGIYMHLEEKGYHFYEAPLSWDCRLGVITREEGLKEIGFEGSARDIEGILHRIGYYAPSAVTDAVVVDKEDKYGDKYLCAYLVSGQEIDEEQLKAYLLEELPDYMIPRYFIRLEKIPLTRNGKVDRDALPEAGAKINTTDFNAPRDPLEIKLAEIWSDVLEIEKDRVGIDNNFFQLGGHSLRATLLISKIQKALDVQIPLSEIFTRSTIRKISNFVKKRGAAKNIYTAVSKVEEKEYYEVSHSQNRLFILEQVEEVISTAYNLTNAALIEGKLDKRRFEDAFHTLIKRHESFRTSFEVRSGKPVQIIHEAVDFSIENMILDTQSPQHQTPNLEQENQVKEIIKKFIKPFDINKAPLLRAALIRLSQEKHVLLLDMHHIISDGVSMSILVREFARLYKGEKIAELHLQYKDFAQWQNRWLESTGMNQQAEYWSSRFEADIPVLNLPTDYPRPAVKSFAGKKVILEIDKELTDKITQMMAETETTLFIVLLALYNLLLSKYTGQKDIIVGIPIAGRTHDDLEHVIGMFVNTLALRNYPREECTFEDFLQEVKANTLNAYDNQDYPFEELVDQLNIPRNTGRNPLVEVLFVSENTDMPELAVKGLKFTPYEFENNIAHMDLVLYFMEIGNKINFALEYSSALFKPETAQQMLDHYVEILEQVVENREIALKDIVISHDYLIVRSTLLTQENTKFDF